MDGAAIRAIAPIRRAENITAAAVNKIVIAHLTLGMHLKECIPFFVAALHAKTRTLKRKIFYCSDFYVEKCD